MNLLIINAIFTGIVMACLLVRTNASKKQRGKRLQGWEEFHRPYDDDRLDSTNYDEDISDIERR